MVEEETGKQSSQTLGQGVMGLGMPVRIHVTPMWENDPVWLHGGVKRESGQGRLREPPYTDVECLC